MRIIAGIAKGNILKTIKGLDVRPTSDKVRGAIFNILGGRIIDAHVLDLYSGTGALGIEALSRGARDAVFVENNYTCIKIINENLAKCGFSAEVIKDDVYNAVKKYKEKKFDIVFADPPYAKNLTRNLLSHLSNFSILKNFALAIIEHSKREQVDAPSCWEKIKERKYGDTIVSVYAYKKG